VREKTLDKLIIVNALPSSPLHTANSRHCEETIMKANEGNIDRALRVVVGLGLLALTLVGPHTPWGYIGIVPLATGLIGYCPLYSLLGINTCPLSSKK
jgi:hypothetical protein